MTDKQTNVEAAIALLRERGFTQDVEGRLCPPAQNMTEATALFANVVEADSSPFRATRIRAGDIDDDACAAIRVLHEYLAAVRAEREA